VFISSNNYGNISLNVLGFSSTATAILASVLFNILILILMIPVAIRGVKYKPMRSIHLVQKFFAIFGIGGIIMPILCIKLIDYFLAVLFL
jgi:K+-transporting ATPase ATPase B chain